MIHICDVCLKTFRTTQHLNQHKNRKKKCTPYAENTIIKDNNIIKTDALIENQSKYGKINNSVIDNNLKFELSNTQNVVFKSEEMGVPDFDLSLFPSEYTTQFNSHDCSPTEINENKNEKQKVNSSVEISSNCNNNQDLSITNLIDFISNHKKVLIEKNKLESTLVILKKHIDQLTQENNTLKQKISTVNRFIFDYRSSGNISNPNVNNSINSNVNVKNSLDVSNSLDVNDNLHANNNF